MNKENMQKEFNNIEFILRQHKDSIGDFNNCNFTLGYIISVIERVNNTQIQ